jgi:hypothetical protein
MKFLIYNSFSFHHEMIGFVLEFCKVNNHNVDVYSPKDEHQWLDAYAYLGFEFGRVLRADTYKYDKTVLLTDSDLNFHDIHAPEDLIVISHWYINRYFTNRINIPMSPFRGEHYNEEFIIPAFNIATKFNKHRSYFSNIIYVIVLGEHDKTESDFDFITNKDVIFQFINRRPPRNIVPSKRFEVYVNLPALQLFQMFANARYFLVTDCFEEKRECYKTSSSIALAFSAGAQLIVPKSMNAYLRLRSAIIYDKDTILTLKHPNFDVVYREREELIFKRDRILNKYAAAARKIPARIFQVCIAPFIAANIPEFVKSKIKTLNPLYNYIVYNDEMIDEYLIENPRAREKYLFFDLACHRKDFIEMFLLYEYGGVYFDIDQDPVMSFDNIVLDADFVISLPVERTSGANTGFIACVKNSPIIKDIISRYMILDIARNFKYDTLCAAAGDVLKTFLGVEILQEGTYYRYGNKIIIGNETTLFGTYESCLVKYVNNVWFYSRYKEYPWNLRGL